MYESSIYENGSEGRKLEAIRKVTVFSRDSIRVQSARRLSTLVQVFLLLIATPSLATTHYYGEGTNTTLSLEFNVRLLLEINGDVVSGHFDATETPGEATACGRSDFLGNIANGVISFSFVSTDDDPGCASQFTSFDMVATVSPNAEIINGSFIVNDGESQGTWTVFRGMTYLGGGRNTTAGLDWVGGIVFSDVGPNRVVGFLDADGIPGGTTICGAGLFAGSKLEDTLTFSYVSNDLDPGCGFEFGVQRDYSGTISADGSQVSGTYTIESGSEGNFTFNHRHFADGFESGTLGCWSSSVGN